MMDPRAAGRAFFWVKKHQPESLVAFTHAMYDAYWVKGLDLSSADAIAAIELPATVERQWLLNGIQTKEAGQMLRAGVDESIKLGVFGSPTIIVDGEMFWGVQNFGLLDEWLEEGGW
jgi:2-hydroxychromene-2-carboxylate isomerase